MQLCTKYTVCRKLQSAPLKATFTSNNKTVQMEVDTGASVYLINKSTLNSYGRNEMRYTRVEKTTSETSYLLR